MRAHRDTERVLTALQPGDTVGITRGIVTTYATVTEIDLDGIVVRYQSGAHETVRVASATQHDRVTPPQLEVRS